MAASVSSFLRKGAMIRSATPIRPVGEKTMKPTKSSPKNRSQLEVKSDRYSRNSMKNSAPSAGPMKERMPPITTMARSSPENWMAIGSAEVKRWWKAESTPAKPVSVAETVKAISL